MWKKSIVCCKNLKRLKLAVDISHHIYKKIINQKVKYPCNRIIIQSYFSEHELSFILLFAKKDIQNKYTFK